MEVVRRKDLILESSREAAQVKMFPSNSETVESLQLSFSPKQARNTMWLPFGLKGKYFGEKTSFLESPCKAEQGMMSPANSDTVESLRSSSFRPKEARNTVCIFSDANGSISKSKPHFSNPHAKLSKWRCFHTLLKAVKSLHSFLSTRTGEEIGVAPIRCKWVNCWEQSAFRESPSKTEREVRKAPRRRENVTSLQSSVGPNLARNTRCPISDASG